MSNDFNKIISDCSGIITDNIKTPRDVIRFINLFMPKYEKNRDRVDFHDFLILSLIQYKHYDEYRYLYDERFTRETTREIIITNTNNEPENKPLQLLLLDENIATILSEKVKDKERRADLRELLIELFGEKDSYNEEVFSQIKFRGKFKAYFEVLVTKAGATYNQDLFDEQIFKLRLENAFETGILEYLKISTGLDIKDEEDLRDYLQKLLWVNKRKVEQIDRIRELILKDSDTAKILQTIINNYTSIILDEFKKIPPLNILADFVNDRENKIILAKNEIFDIIKAEIDMNMIEVKGGEFTMVDGSKAKKVKVDEFKISRFQVTQELYRAVMSENPSHFNGHNLPVESVSWYDAVEFCNKLSALCGRKLYYQIDKETKDKDNKNESDGLKWIVKIDKNADGFRLPTETQWEYAARHCRKDNQETKEYAGTSDRKELKDYAWYYENSGDKELDEAKWSADLRDKNNCRTHTVGTAKKAEDLLIHDMSGNVWEWCWDWYREYDDKDTDNPVGASTGSNRVLRGGSWYISAQYCRVSIRRINAPGDRDNYIGFRLALVS